MLNLRIPRGFSPYRNTRLRDGAFKITRDLMDS